MPAAVLVTADFGKGGSGIWRSCRMAGRLRLEGSSGDRPAQALLGAGRSGLGQSGFGVSEDGGSVISVRKLLQCSVTPVVKKRGILSAWRQFSPWSGFLAAAFEVLPPHGGSRAVVLGTATDRRSANRLLTVPIEWRCDCVIGRVKQV